MPRKEYYEKAKSSLVKLPNFKHQARALELLNDPSDLSQTDFGICGMAAICYTLLVHRPDVFVDLANDIVRRTTLVKELRSYYWSGKPSRTPQLDYLVMAGLAYRFRGSDQRVVISTFGSDGRWGTKVKKLSDVFDRNVEFSKTFEVDDVMWDPSDPHGHLAATQASVVGMVKAVLPSAYADKLKHDVAPATVVARINTYFSIYETAFAFAGIRAFDMWRKVPEAHLQSNKNERRWKIDKKPKVTKAPKFEHWVWLSGPIEDDGQYYTLHYWTWRSKYRLVIEHAVFSDYLYGFVAGHVDMTFKRR